MYLRFFPILLLGLCLALPTMAHDAPVLDGALIRTANDTRVYYIEDAQKRWISSEQAFYAHGFKWTDVVTMEAHHVDALSSGPDVYVDSQLRYALNGTLLPDLTPVAPYDLRFATENGETRLRFTATFWNRGQGAFELLADSGERTGDGEYSATQRIFKPGGGYVDRPMGTLFWHAVHDHFHYDEFGSYELELIRPTDGSHTVSPLTLSQKTTFCLRDDERIGAPAEGPKRATPVYGGCRGLRQGVSVGWADVYRYTLPDQYFNMTGLPAGIYAVRFVVDPHRHFAEMRRENNVSVTIVELDPVRRIVNVIGTASPYETANNRFPDGTLVRADNDLAYYIVAQNKKRLMRSEDVIRSYGLDPNDAFLLPRSTVDAIPSQTLVRDTESGIIYILNVGGFKRRILNPTILASYTETGATHSPVNRTEIDSLPTTNLIARFNEDRVYSINDKRHVGTFAEAKAMGLDSDSVHGVNDLDFREHAVSRAAESLVIPWDIAFLPDGDLLVTERTGTLRRIGAHPASFPVANVYTGGEGGLMGIALHPDFAQNHYVYLYYTTDDNGRKNRVDRFRLETDRLVFDRVILESIPGAQYHDGGQIDFGPDGKLYVATGDASNPDSAQDRNSLAGKILRVNDDGSTPSDNPFGNAVWSYGHRNPQGLAWDAQGRMYAAEHGPTGEFGLCCRDEINRIVKGGNYGWPVITGTQTREGMIAPIATSGGSLTWAPSGLVFVGGSLFFSGLRASTLYELPVREDGTVGALKAHLSGAYGRLRASVIGPDGNLYLTTSNRDGRGTARTGDDKVLRVHIDFLR